MVDENLAAPSFGDGFWSGVKGFWEKAHPNYPTGMEEALRGYAALGGWKKFRSGEWLLAIIEKSFKNYLERATAEYFLDKYSNLSVDRIARKLISVASKNAAAIGGITGATVSTDEIVGLLTGFEGGVGLPANIGIAGASICGSHAPCSHSPAVGS